MTAKMKTTLALLLAVAIALGGLALFQMALARWQEHLLLEIGEVDQNTILGDGREQDVETSAYQYAQIRLNANEWKEFLKGMEEQAEIYPHEPYYGQLTMEQAIRKGEDWLNGLKEKEPKLGTALGGSEEREISASLFSWRAGPEDTKNDWMLMSAWNVDWYSPKTEIHLQMNAVTGEVNLAQIDLKHTDLEISKEEQAELLEKVAKDYAIPIDGKVEETPAGEGERLMSLSMDGGNLYAISWVYEIDGFYETTNETTNAKTNAQSAGGSGAADSDTKNVFLNLRLGLRPIF